MTTRPSIAAPVVGQPISQSYLNAQVYTPINYLYNYAPQVLAYASISANTTTVTTTEAVAITTGSITFQNGRAYRISYKGLGSGTVNGDEGQFRVRKTNLSGTAWVDSFGHYLPNGNSMFDVQNICVNNSGSDVTAALVGTYARYQGTGSISVAASTNNVAYVLVEDMGLAANFPGATPIT